jgi:zinc protease
LKIRPEILSLKAPSFPTHETFDCGNGVMLYGFNGALNDILRIDLVFEGGRWAEQKPLVADAVARMFKSGTNSKNALQIETGIDQLGATIKAHAGYHGFTISLFTMRKYLPQVLNIFLDCWMNVNFPESELAIFKKNALAKLKVNEQKADFLAEMAFKEQLFGEHHPYGYTTKSTFIKALHHDDLKKYYNEHVSRSLPRIYIGGRYDDHDIQIITEKFGQLGFSLPKAALIHTLTPDPIPFKHVHKKGLSQVSIMMGKRLFNKLHPDYPSFILLNTIFGGYFGSRLMKNIREDKGFTYGIYSTLQTYRNDGAFFVQTDTSNEHLNECLSEIKNEIHNIQHELVSAEELLQAKNYLMGKYLTRVDGPFAQMETFKNFHTEGVPIEYFNVFTDVILETKPATLQELANTYLNAESMICVVAGS